MNPDDVSTVCVNLITPIQNKLDGLVGNLASKEDLKSYLLDIEFKFMREIKSCFDHLNSEIESRDRKITTLETEIDDLKQYCVRNDHEFESLTQRVEQLEVRQNPPSSIASVSAASIDSLDGTHAPEVIDGEVGYEDEEEEIEKEVLELLCLGDSIIKWMNIDAIKSNAHTKKVCLPGAKIVDIREALIDLADSYTIKNIYLHVGSNEIPAKSPYEVTEELASFLAEIGISMPSTKVYLSAVLPKIDENYLSGINQINYVLCSICNTIGMIFVQHPFFCWDGQIDWALYAHDGIHLNRRGIAQLTADIKRLASSFI